MEVQENGQPLDFDDPVALLARGRFGIKYLFPYQRLVIANILDAFDEREWAGPVPSCSVSAPPPREDAGGGLSAAPGSADEEQPERPPARQIVVLPTGFGKSICFQVPSQMLPGPTLVVYPLLSLMADQKRSLEARGIKAALFRGGMSAEERKEAENLVESGAAKLIITNPESLAKGRLLEFLRSRRLSHLAIDEAHCVSEWGETFRPSYLELGRAVNELKPATTSAFTATASPIVFKAVSQHLFGDEPYRLVEGDPDRANLYYSVIKTLSKMHTLERILRSSEKPCIVFCSSRKGTEIIALRLRERFAGTEIRFYHAGLERPEKKKVEDWFYQSTTGILIATCAYGMGVDKKDIRTVIHYEIPGTIEAYLQEAGRGGRDGLPARAVLIVGSDEERALAREADRSRRERRRAMIGYALSESGCRREALISLLGARTENPCSGCDRCDGTARADFEGSRGILRLVRANPRMLSAASVRCWLLAEHRGGRLMPGAGAFEDWDKDDASAAIESALRLGIIHMREKGLWKGKIEKGPGVWQ